MTIDEFKKKIAPFMHTGYVAMDANNRWYWYSEKPMQIGSNKWGNPAAGLIAMVYLSRVFNIEPVEDWTQSLIEVGK